VRVLWLWTGTRMNACCMLTRRLIAWPQYHLAMGVSHIYMGVNYKWGSEDMDRFMVSPLPHSPFIHPLQIHLHPHTLSHIVVSHLYRPR
jgi:hypothetical protein